ncbi:uncharacterized protein PFL1_02134 [Pseudozyma flocculosa PF-1]|uniref:Zn(2)-C6 fungal-type domain-containing protein n=1 Tax=Pseudozyma flocculosa TaxID=84751 RepID=A0A5C3F119_9BASI|nr:uncharacterized protein PFL1_02134 [Pseudozyma flocculosa PF-1]EPQ30610.1 hypothetical protein PFL1_02134 [Pseudozyma flocculosa PF-1]SPO37705.1 uncharacterized protein PSFLO_03181 [Pseudozyma flocculosa]
MYTSHPQHSSSGPMRSHKPGDDRDRKGPIAAPVKSACTFCRSRKSRCDGNKPCGTCIGRGRTDDCVYTVSRRGGKPKQKQDPTAEVQSHLSRLFHLTDMPYAFRRPGGMSGTVNEPGYQSDVPFFSGALSPPQFQPPSNFSQTAQFPLQPGSQPPQMLQSQQQGQQLQQPSFDLPPQQSFQQHAQVPNQAQQQQQRQQPNQSQQSQAGQGMFGDQSGFSQATSGFASGQNAFDVGPSAGQNVTLAPTWQGADFLSGLQSGDRSAIASQAQNAGFSDKPAPWSYSQPAAPQNATRAPQPAASVRSSQPLPEESVGVRSLLIDYYKYLYRFLPVIPGPRYIDILSSAMQPDSSFILALQCVLPLLRNEEQPIGAFHHLGGAGLSFGTEEKRQHLKERTTMMERKANEAIDRLLEQADSDSSGEKYLELIQTLCVMVVYEYGTGHAIKSRLKADQALGLAMSQGLHKLKHPSASDADAARSAPSSFASTSSAGTHSLRNLGVDAAAIYEMRKRCWWTVWSLVLWSAYNTGRIPTIRADDPRVRSEVPQGQDPSAWTSNISSLQALLLVQDRVLALAQSSGSQGEEPPYRPGSSRGASTSPRAGFSPEGAGSVSAGQSPFGFGRLASNRSESDGSGEEVPSTFSTLPSHASRQEILDSMQEIDAFLQDQIRTLEKRGGVLGTAKQPPASDDLGSVEPELEDSLRTAAAVQLYTSSLTLHIGQAFQGASLFERKLCFLNSINDNNDAGASGGVCREPMPNAFYDELADMAAAEAPHGIPPGLSQTYGPSGGTSGSSSSVSWGSSPAPQVAQPVQQDLYARGPFLPRLSLQRCVHASKKLLDIAKNRHGKVVNPNPFNCCSFVLISFVLLMQALAVHGGFGSVDGSEGDEGDDDNVEGNGDGAGMELDDGGFQGSRDSPAGGGYSHELMQSGRSAHALDAGAVGSSDGGDGSSLGGYGMDASSDPMRQAQLRGIWTRVREARDTLIDLGKHWEAVIPMADEVNLCLETSQLLLSS